MELPEIQAANAPSGGSVVPNDGPSKGSPPQVPTNPQSVRKSWRFWIAFVTLCVCAFLSSIDATILATALPPIADELKGSSLLAFWCATSFLLAQTVVQPVYGSLSEIFGRKKVLLATIIVFLLGSVLCARSTSMEMLVASRTVQGIGGGGLLTLVEVIMTDMIPIAERGAFMGIIALVWATGSVVGPIIGGVCAGTGQWRWIFYLNIPICVLCFVGTAQFLTLRMDRVPLSIKVRRIDWIGIITFMASTTSLLFGITVGGTLYDWNSFRTLVPLVLGAAGLMSFGVYEWFFPKEPMVPFEVFSSRTAISAYFGTFLHGMVSSTTSPLTKILWNLNIYLVFWFQSVRIRSPLGAAVDSLPLIICSTFSAAIAGFLITKRRRFKHIVSHGWLFATVGMGLNCILSPTSNLGERIGFLILEGFGMGALFPALQLAAQAPQSERYVGIATAIFTFVRSFGQTFGVAIGGVIFQNEFDKRIAQQVLQGNLSPKYEISGPEAEAFVSMLSSVPEAVRTVFQYIYANSIRVMWYVMIPFAGIGLLTSFLSKDLLLNQEHDTAQRFEEGKVKPKADTQA